MNRLASPYLYHTSLYFLLFLFLYLHTLIQSPSFIPSSNFSFFRPSSSKFSNLPLSIPHSPQLSIFSKFVSSVIYQRYCFIIFHPTHLIELIGEKKRKDNIPDLWRLIFSHPECEQNPRIYAQLFMALVSKTLSRLRIGECIRTQLVESFYVHFGGHLERDKSYSYSYFHCYRRIQFRELSLAMDEFILTKKSPKTHLFSAVPIMEQLVNQLV